jgi:hypothetical protein
MDSLQRSNNQSEAADGKNGFLKMFLNLSEFCALYVDVLTQFTIYENC